MAHPLSIGKAGRAAAKCGIGWLAVVADKVKVAGPSSKQKQHGRRKTRITTLRHSAPTRLLPMQNSTVERAGAAFVALSSYGGGMLQGDRSDLEFSVGPSATLGIITQGSNRIYKISSSRSKSNQQQQRIEAASSLYPSGDENTTCRASLQASIGKNGFMVMAPDPCVPFSSSSFVQHQTIEMEKGASAILVDWYGAGRVANGERWELKRLESRSSLFYKGDDIPFLVESVALDRRFASSQEDPFGFDDTHDFECNAFCSVILHVSQVNSVMKRFASLQECIVTQYTRIRRTDFTAAVDDISDNSKFAPKELLDSLGGRVFMGISQIQKENDREKCETYVVRVVATSNEDIYRVLHSCMQPLQPLFGVEFYRDRIPASTSVAPAPMTISQNKKQNENLVNEWEEERNATESFHTSTVMSSQAAWCAYMLADSSLPTGGFSHSAGIEAASQLGLFRSSSHPDEDKVSSYILAATRSTAQMLTPFVYSGRQLVEDYLENKGETECQALFHDKWLEVDRYAHATLASNAPACRASLDQGQGLLRVAHIWVRSNSSNRQAKKPGDAATEATNLASLLCLKETMSESSIRGHIGPIFGIVGGLLGLYHDEACRVLAFCAARDMVSAAVRLNLIGPIAGVSILDKAWGAVKDGLEAANFSMADAEVEHTSATTSTCTALQAIKNAAPCSPMIEAIHPCHDLLSVRLFRT